MELGLVRQDGLVVEYGMNTDSRGMLEICQFRLGLIMKDGFNPMGSLGSCDEIEL